ncbi:hypothetical protein SAMN05414139_08280 [Burkholderia sp. D7]|nr:hypothetical protein SAMN05414139_08280 [Burkholderia sp. D7]
MIADRTGRTVSFLAARVKNRLRFAAPTGRKATQVLAHRAFRLRGQEKTVSAAPGRSLLVVDRLHANRKRRSTFSTVGAGRRLIDRRPRAEMPLP